MAQKGAIFVFCSSCKILDFASYVSPRIIADMAKLYETSKFYLKHALKKEGNTWGKKSLESFDLSTHILRIVLTFSCRFW